MRIINGTTVLQDLGMHYPKPTSKKKQRYYLIKCQCGAEEKKMGLTVNSSDKPLTCKKCGIAARDAVNKRLNIANFFTKASTIHNNKYSYEKSNYIDILTEVIITCPTHGEFNQKPREHLQGAGCQKCATEASTFTTEEFKEKLKKVTQTISVVGKYRGALLPIHVKCDCGHTWTTAASVLLRGSGCPVCAKSGYKVNKPGKLYYLKIKHNDTFLYKIGITNLTVKRRMKIKDYSKVVASVVWEFEDGQEAYDREQSILNLYKKFKYKGPNILHSGNTELFTEDVGGYFTKGIHSD